MSESRPISDVLNLRPYTQLETLQSLVIETQNEFLKMDYELKYWQSQTLSGAKVDEQIRIVTANTKAFSKRLKFFLKLRDEEIVKIKKMMEEEKVEKQNTKYASHEEITKE